MTAVPATERQRAYLADLGVPGEPLSNGLSKELASRWIDELKGYLERARLPVGAALTPARLLGIDARPDALSRPPSNGDGRPADVEGPTGPAEPGPTDVRAGPADVDDSWLRLELGHVIECEGSGKMSVTLGISEHRARSVGPADAQELAKRGRAAVVTEVEGRLARPGPFAAASTQTPGPIP